MSALESNLGVLLLKATIILVAGLAGYGFMRTASAATRHLGLALAMLGLVLLPALSMSFPGWELEVLPPSAGPHTESRALSGLELEEPWPAGDSTVAATLPLMGVPSPAMSGDAASSVLMQIDPTVWLLLGWVLGAAVVLARLATGLYRVRSIVHRGERIIDRGALRMLDECGELLELRLRPLLIESRKVDVPLVWGWLRPALIVPCGFVSWSPDRMRAVMLHELGHLRRNDWPVLLLGRVVAALYWFHPLAWLVERCAKEECERACDDIVVTYGTKPSDYASHLLSIARGVSESPASVRAALAVVRRSQLNQRLRSILDPVLRRNAPSRTAVSGLGTALLLVLVPLASLQFAERAHADEPRDSGEILLAQHSEHSEHARHEMKEDAKAGPGQRAYKRGHELHSAGRYQEAAKAFDDAVAEGFRPGAAMYNIACCHALMGDAGRAMSWLERSMEAGFDDPTNLVEDSDFDRIRSDAGFQRLVDDAFAEAELERVFPDHYPYRATLEGFEALKESGSTEGKKWHGLGYKLLSMRELDLAIEAFTVAAENMGDKSGTAMYNLACSYSLAGKERQAIEWLDRAIDAGLDEHGHILEDSDLDGIRDTAEFDRLKNKSEFLSLGRFPQREWEQSGYSTERWAPAIVDYRQYVTENPSSGRGWFNLGWALHHSERFDEAVGAFEKSVELGFRKGTATYNIACGNAKLNRTDAAMDALSAAVEAGMLDYGHVAHDEDLENLHDDARFQALLVELEAKQEAKHAEKMKMKMKMKQMEKMGMKAREKTAWSVEHEHAVEHGDEHD